MPAADLSERRSLLLTLALCALLFFPGLGSRALWDQDEGMHAATAKEMVQSGDWVTPTFQGERFFDKPVLFTWMVAGSLSLFGMNEFAARLPAAICGSGTVLATWAIGLRMFGPTGALLSAGILATAGVYTILSRSIVHDIALVLWTTLAMLGFWIAFREDGRRAWPAYLFWLSCGMAALAKGPVAGVPPFLVFVFLAVSRRLDFLWKLRIPTGALLALAVAAPWYVAIARANPDYVETFVYGKILGSLAVEGATRREEPFYFYLLVFPLIFLPWSVYLPAAARQAWRRRTPELTFLFVWFLGTFLGFSAATAKLPTYILPLFPAPALLLGWAARESMAGRWDPGRGYRVPAWALAVGGVGALAFCLLFWIDRISVDHGLDRGWTAYAMLGPAVAFPAAAWLLSRGRLAAFHAVTIGGIALTFLNFELVVGPTLDDHYSSREFSREVDALLPPGAEVPVYKWLVGTWDSAIFYSDRPAYDIDLEDLLERLQAPEPFLAVVEWSRYDDLEEAGIEYLVLDRQGDKLLVSNRPLEYWRKARSG